MLRLLVATNFNSKEKKLKGDLKEPEDATADNNVTTESEYITNQKLAYEKRVWRDLEIDLVVDVHPLQNDQVAIVELEVEIADLKNAAVYVMDMVIPYSLRLTGKSQSRWWTG